MADIFAKAAEYEKMTGRWSARLAPLFAEFAGVRSNGRVLDVGCGTGSLVKFLADRSEELAIVGIDYSGPFIDYARSRFGGPRFSFDVGDATALPYPSGSFDQSLSLLVFMFLTQPEKAASEMRRVTRPGGTVAACTWARAGNERPVIFWEEAIALDPDASVDAPENHSCTRPGELTDVWSATGLAEVAETTLEIANDFSSFDDYWVPFTSGAGPAGVYTEKLGPEHREALRKALRKRLLGDRADGPFTLKAKALAVRGTVPAST